MHFWFSGWRILGIRPGISLGAEDFRALRSPENIAPHSPAVASVYVITSGVGLCKIGMSNNPEMRIAQLQTGNDAPLKLAFALPIPNGQASNVEAMAHRILAAERTSGEWFMVHELRATAAVVAAAQYYGVTVEMTDANSGETLTALAVDRKPPISIGWRIFGTIFVMFCTMGIAEDVIKDQNSPAPIYTAIVAGLICWFLSQSKA